MADDLKSVAVKDIVLNADNPRDITPEGMEELVESLLVFPKMLSKRPPVIDAQTHVVLGGNMRIHALLRIQQMSQQEILTAMQKQTKYKRMTQFQQDELQEYWAKWQKRPYIKVLYDSDFTEEEKAEFVIKDNVSYGKWDFDKLANQWDNDILAEWGMDVWETPNTNIDDFFTDSNTDTSKGKGLHVQVTIPEDMETELEEIKSVVTAAVANYAGVTVK